MRGGSCYYVMAGPERRIILITLIGLLSTMGSGKLYALSTGFFGLPFQLKGIFPALIKSI